MRSSAVGTLVTYGATLGLAVQLGIAEEEQFVLLDRPANSAAELILAVEGGRQSGERIRRESCESRSVELQIFESVAVNTRWSRI